MNDEQGSDRDRAGAAPFPRFRRRVEADVQTLGVRFADALVAGHGARAEAIARDARAQGLSVAAIYGRIITPALYVVGDLWARRELSVSDEHLATIICHRVLAILHATLRPPAPLASEHILLAGPAGQRHDLGLRMVADVLEGAGYVVTHLGGDVPSQALRHAVQRHAPDVVGLSLTTADGEVALEQAIAAVQAVKPDALLLLGGQAAPARLAGPRIALAGDIETAVVTLERLLERAAVAPEAVDARAAQLSIVPEPDSDPVDERLAREAAQIGEIAREHARLAERYRRLAFEDALSGLPNRRAFEDRYLELTAEHDRRRGGPSLVVLFLDVDNLKVINDEHGHDAGDRALKRVASALRRSVREQDLPARLGGDEFAVLLPALDPQAARRVAARVQDALRADTDAPPVTVSGGVAHYDGDRRRTLIRADQALYEAKRANRNAITIAA